MVFKVNRVNWYETKKNYEISKVFMMRHFQAAHCKRVSPVIETLFQAIWLANKDRKYT